jgi:hypothetical protein
MNKSILETLIIFACILAFFGCPSPGQTTQPAAIDIAVTSASATGIPGFCAIGSGKTASFSFTVQNNGRSIANGTELLLVYVLVANKPDMTYADLFAGSFDIVASGAITSGFDSGTTHDFAFNSCNISSHGTAGNNYYYVLACSNDKKNFLSDATPADNVDSLNNSSPCDEEIRPYTSWATVSPLDGGASYPSVVPVPAFDQWYSSSVVIGSGSKWYSVAVSLSGTYDIYWDENSEGSGNYTGDVVAYICQTNGTSYPSLSAFKGYKTPLTVTPVETSILIYFQSSSSGTFAFGIRKEP